MTSRWIYRNVTYRIWPYNSSNVPVWRYLAATLHADAAGRGHRHEHQRGYPLGATRGVMRVPLGATASERPARCVVKRRMVSASALSVERIRMSSDYRELDADDLLDLDDMYSVAAERYRSVPFDRLCVLE